MRSGDRVICHIKIVGSEVDEFAPPKDLNVRHGLGFTPVLLSFFMKIRIIAIF